jgi:O2-independent ubiquinone biosynthesis accessory factor UbiT
MTLLAIPNKVRQTLTPIAKRLLSPLTFSKVSTKMPFILNAALVEQLCNKAFSEQITDGDFDFLERKILQIEILDANLWVGLGFAQKKVRCVHFKTNSSPSDVTLSINSTDAISLIQQEIDPDTLFFQRKLKINGDTNLAHQVKNTIDTLDPEVIPSFLRSIIAEYKKKVL